MRTALCKVAIWHSVRQLSSKDYEQSKREGSDVKPSVFVSSHAERRENTRPQAIVIRLHVYAVH